MVRGCRRERRPNSPLRNRSGFFRPPYVGGRGWIGVRLDRDIDWTEIAEICRDAYRVIAPARPGGPAGQLAAVWPLVISAAYPEDSETPAPPCP